MPVTPVILLVIAVAIVLAGLRRGAGPTVWITQAVNGERPTRPHVAIGWAIGIAVAYGASTLIALALIGRIEALTVLPRELVPAALSLGLTGAMTRDGLIETVAAIGGGMAIGALFVAVAARRGWRAIGPRYRSPAMVQRPEEIAAAMLLAAAAGIAEEAFYRLLVPLLGTLVFGSGTVGCVLGWALFTLAHRYQGRGGMIAVALVGAVLTWLYLATGQLWLVMAVHCLVDANALVLRPWLERRQRW